MRAGLVFLLLSGCSLINDFDKFTFSSEAQNTVRPSDAGARIDASEPIGMDSGIRESDGATLPGDAGALELDAQGPSERDAGINQPDGGWCFNCGGNACPELGEPSYFVPGAKALCPPSTPGNLNEMGPCRVSCKRQPNTTGMINGKCWDCQVPVCGELGNVPEVEGTCPKTTQGHNMLGPCRVPCE